MTDDERLAQLRRELDELDDTPLSSHPETLERVHRALVEELDALADVEAVDATGGLRHDGQPDLAEQPDEAVDAAGAHPGVDQRGGASS